MVRNISGVLMDIGSKKKTPEWAKQVLEGKERSEAGITAPPGGLYLADVEYPVHFAIPAGSRNTGKQPKSHALASGVTKP